jgi:hypothetical protein
LLGGLIFNRRGKKNFWSGELKPHEKRRDVMALARQQDTSWDRLADHHNAIRNNLLGDMNLEFQRWFFGHSQDGFATNMVFSSTEIVQLSLLDNALFFSLLYIGNAPLFIAAKDSTLVVNYSCDVTTYNLEKNFRQPHRPFSS